MYFTARVPGLAESNAGGAIGLATSPDLFEWALQPPTFIGGFGQLEVPQVFSIENRWYCLFCTSSAHWSAAYRQTYTGPCYRFTLPDRQSSLGTLANCSGWFLRWFQSLSQVCISPGEHPRRLVHPRFSEPSRWNFWWHCDGSRTSHCE